jgi:hypothetical protein
MGAGFFGMAEILKVVVQAFTLFGIEAGGGLPQLVDQAAKAAALARMD